MKKPKKRKSPLRPKSLPLQPIYLDASGTIRFRANPIVRHLIDLCTGLGVCDMNKLALMEFSQADREQFAQLIGYSLGGFAELSYVSDETYARAERLSRRIKK